MLHLSFKNTFLEVHFDGACGSGEDQDDLELQASSLGVSPKATRASPHSSPTATRARSAEACCSPTRVVREDRPCVQLERLNSWLASAERPSFALDVPAAEPAAPASGSASIADSEETRPTSRGGLPCVAGASEKGQPWSCTSTETSASDHGPREYVHKQVPRRVDLEARGCICSTGGPTTLMIRNVPNCYTQQELQAELESMGLAGSFDFLYMPVDRSSKACVGYAFVNFVAHAWAAKCLAALQGHVFSQHGKSKEAKASVAHLQGLEANLAHYEMSAGKSARSVQRPLVFAGGEAR